jgi:hypothetical protein
MRKAKSKIRKKKSDFQVLADEILKPVKGQLTKAKSRSEASSRRDARHRIPPRYIAIMQPLVIVPDDIEGKPVIADAGSIIELMNQHTLYRERTSPITHTSDERLVKYGKTDHPTLGWISNKVPNLVKPVHGPTFLVTTSAEDSVNAWDLFRLKIARIRKANPAMWCAPWIVLHGKKYPRELREVTRLFGGKTVKNESFEVRCARLFQLILHTEIEMSTATAKKIGKKKGKKSAKSAPAEKVSKKSKMKTPEKVMKKKKRVTEEPDAPIKKKGKKTAKSGKKTKTSGEFRANNREHDDYIVKRLIKENPRREGTYKASVWALLKKGMTVKQFVEKGGGRTEIQRYIESGWVKLLRPSASE